MLNAAQDRSPTNVVQVLDKVIVSTSDICVHNFYIIHLLS